MELILEVTNPHVAEQSFETVHRFRQAGGTIGRSSACHWQIPDPSRHVSSQHALIGYEDGSFFVEDLSTNGLLINDQTKPLGKGNRHALQHGDRLGLGQFRLSVTLWHSAEQADPLPTSVADFFQSLDEGLPAAGHEDLAQQLSPSASREEHEMLPSEEELEQELATLSWALDSVQVPELAKTDVTEQTSPQRANATQLVSNSDAQPAVTEATVRSTKKVATTKRQPLPPSQATLVRTEPALTLVKKPQSTGASQTALFAALGLKPESIQHLDDEQLMAQSGQLLRKSLRALMDLLALRTEQKNRYRLGVTLIQSRENNPLKYSVNEVQALKQFLVDPQPECLGIAESLTQTVNDLGNHMMAVESAYQKLFLELIEHLLAESTEESSTTRSRWGLGQSRSNSIRRKLKALQSESTLRSQFLEQRFARLYEKALQQSSHQHSETPV